MLGKTVAPGASAGVKEAAEREKKIVEMREVGDKISALDKEVADVEVELTALTSALPNVPDERTPIGVSEDENIVLRTIGQLPEFDLEPKAHWDLGPALGIIDFERGTKITGSRFYVLSGPGARLQRAFIAFMLDLHTRQGYTEKYLPFVVKYDTVYGAGQLPKFADNLYKGLTMRAAASRRTSRFVSVVAWRRSVLQVRNNRPSRRSSAA